MGFRGVELSFHFCRCPAQNWERREYLSESATIKEKVLVMKQFSNLESAEVTWHGQDMVDFPERPHGIPISASMILGSTFSRVDLTQGVLWRRILSRGPANVKTAGPQHSV